MLRNEVVGAVGTDLFTVRQAMAYLNVSYAQIYVLMQRGCLKSFSLKSSPHNIRGKRLILRSSIDEYVRAALEAELNKAKDKVESAQRNAEVAASQCTALEAELKKARAVADGAVEVAAGKPLR